MNITNIRIENFRGVQKSEPIPLENFSAIVGKNDAGKSIILHAIATFLDTKENQVVFSDFNDPQKPIVIECIVSDPNLKEILLKKIKSKFKKDDGLEEFLSDVIKDDSITIQKVFIAPTKTPELVSLRISSFEGDDFENVYAKTDDELNEVLDKHNIEIPVAGTGRNSKLEKIKHIKQFCRDNLITPMSAWIEDIYKAADILPPVELFPSDYGLEADTKFKTVSVAELQDFFEEETKDSTSRLNIIEEDIKKKMSLEAESIKGYMSEYTPSLQTVEIFPSLAWKDAVKSVDVNFQFEGDQKPIQMSHKGAGYRRLFMVARFRYLAEKNKGTNVVYLIEEPETFLHPSAQHDLLVSFSDLAEDNQVVISTHSPVFAGAANHASVILCRKTEQSTYTHSDESNKDEFIKKIIEELGIKPHYNLVDSFEKIFFAESHHDISFYDIIANTVLQKNLETNEKILSLPYGGSSIDSFVNIKYFERSNRELYLIADSDKHLDQSTQQLQIDRCNDFSQKAKAKSQLLQKACIENYYHPRAIERLYKLTPNSLSFFADDENVKETLKTYNSTNGTQIKPKNNMDIFNEMSKEEWEEVLEQELIDFLEQLF